MTRKRLYARDVTYYTEGDCWILAYWLAVLGDGLRVVTDYRLEGSWTHVAATDGTFVIDVNGWQTAEAWATKWRAVAGWEKHTLLPEDFNSYAKTLGFWPSAEFPTSVSNYDLHPRHAQAVARYLLAQPKPKAKA